MFDTLTENSFRTRPVNKNRVLTLLVFTMALIVSAHTTLAQTTIFTYQGHLTDAGAPANGSHDFEFKLYDAAGTQVGATLTRDDIQVTNGVFVVQLDFGVSPFASTTASTLEIGVRPGASTGAFTALTPRQPITSSPYAIKSLSAAELGGVAANQYVLTGDPRLSDERPPAPGNSNYIQNQTATAQAAGFNISGDGVIGGKVGIGTTSPAFALDVKAEDGFGNTTARIHSSRQAAIVSLDSTIGGQNQIWNVESGILGNPGLFGILNRNTLQARLTIDPGGRVTIPGNLDVGQTLNTNTLTGNFTIPATRITGALAVGNGGTGLGSAGAAGNFLRSDGAVWTSSPIQVSDIPNLSSSFIQNTIAQQPTSNFNVSGTGTATMFDAAAQYNIGGNRVLSATGTGLGVTSVGIEAGSSGTDNSFVGFRAGLSNAQGSSNSFFGSESGVFNTTGSGNTFAGTASGKFNGGGSNNSFYGALAGFSNTNGFDNTFVGVAAGQSNGGGINNSFFGRNSGLANTASFNSFFGANSGASNTIGEGNSFFGNFAGFRNTTGQRNTFVGFSAGEANTDGERNSFYGSGAGNANTIGSFNSFFGRAAGLSNTEGSNNVFIGHETGLANTTGSNNTLLGNLANVGANNLTNATAIGAGAVVSASNSLVLGNNANVGIGTSAPGSKLTVAGVIETTAGGVKFPDGTTQTTAASASSITDITAGGGLTGGGNTGNLTLDVGAGPGINVAADMISIADAGVTTAKLADSAVTAPKIALGQVVKMVNGLTDGVTLAAGANVTITPAGNTLTIASTGGGGGGNAILNQTTQQAGANFNISGDGTAAGTVSGGVVNAATQFNLGGSRIVSAAGTGNLFVGFDAGQSTTPGNPNPNAGIRNSFFGISAGLSNTFGGRNSYFGREAGRNSNGSGNSFFGADTGNRNTTGNGNTFIGTDAGFTNRTGSNNTLLGFGANVGANNLSNATAIGWAAQVSVSNSLVLGNGANVGIGTSTPVHRLSIAGGPAWTSAFWSGAMDLQNAAAIGWQSNSAGQRFGIGHTNGGLFMFRTASNPGDTTNSPIYDLVINDAGNVGIGTSTPSAKLTVNGGITGSLIAGGIVASQFVTAGDISVGRLTFRALSGVSGNHLCVDGAFLVGFCGSSLRYKTDLQPFSDGLKFVNQLRPISFKWKSDGALDVGFGAEDVAQVNPLFVTYNDKGQVEGVKYDRLSVAFVNAFKEQQAQIERQQQQIDELKKLVCLAHPTAEVCQE